MLLLLLTFLNLFDYSSVGVLSLLFWGVAWWWYHCRTRHQWSWWPNPGPSCKYKIFEKLYLLVSHTGAHLDPVEGVLHPAEEAAPREEEHCPDYHDTHLLQHSTVQYSTVQYSTAPGPARIWWWRTAPWSHSQLQTVAGMFAKSRWHLQSSYCTAFVTCVVPESMRHDVDKGPDEQPALSPSKYHLKSINCILHPNCSVGN